MAVLLGRQRIPIIFAGFLPTSEAGKKMPAKLINVGDYRPTSVSPSFIVSLPSMPRRSPNAKGCLVWCLSPGLRRHLVTPKQSMKPGPITKRAPGDVLPSEMIWAMRSISLVGTTTPVTGVWGYPRATPTACISRITVATVVMREAHGRSLLPLKATRKRRLDKPPSTKDS